MSSSQRSTWVLSILLIIVIILAGLDVYYSSAILGEVTKTPTPTPTTKPTLTVYALWSGDEERSFRQALGNFTQQTGINVSYYGYTTQDLLISVPLQLKAPPYSVDLVIAPWPYWIQQLSPYLTPVNNLVNVTDYPANIISPINSSGSLLAAPFKLSGKPGFWYRPSFFAAHGLTAPTNFTQWQSFLTKAKLEAAKPNSGIEAVFASGDTVGWPLSDQTEGFIMGIGGYQQNYTGKGYQMELDLETGPSKLNWTDPRVKAVFTNLTTLLQDGYFSPPDDWETQVSKLWAGKYVAYWQGSFITTLTSDVKNLTDFAFFGFPGTTGVVGAVDYMVIPKYAPHMTEVQQLVKYLAGPVAQEIMVKQGGFLATNKNVPASAYKPIDKTVVDFMSRPQIHIVPDLDDTIGGKWQTTFWDQLKGLWTSASPTTMNNVLNTLQTAAIQQQG